MSDNSVAEDVWPDIPCSKRRAAYCQAGHAAVALREAIEIIQISIDDDATGWIDVRYPDLNDFPINGLTKVQARVNAVIRALLAGPAAQLRYSFGTYPADGPQPEFNLADRFTNEHDAVWKAVALAATPIETVPRSFGRRGRNQTV
jgi:hypothetical protein